MSLWKCGKCGVKYTTEELLKLEKIKSVEEDTNPKKQHGYTSKCPCGYVFHKEKWYLKDLFDIYKDGERIMEIVVSTVDLELNHGFEGKELYYETMIFPNEIYSDKYESLDCHYQYRYETKQEAIKGHKKVIELLKKEKFTIEPSKYTVILEIED